MNAWSHTQEEMFWGEEYHNCGCVSPLVASKPELPGYCPIHGTDRISIHQIPSQIDWVASLPGSVTQPVGQPSGYTPNLRPVKRRKNK